jgi:hypothetical protein
MSIAPSILETLPYVGMVRIRTCAGVGAFGLSSSVRQLVDERSPTKFPAIRGVDAKPDGMIDGRQDGLVLGARAGLRADLDAPVADVGSRRRAFRDVNAGAVFSDCGGAKLPEPKRKEVRQEPMVRGLSAGGEWIRTCMGLFPVKGFFRFIASSL